MGKNFKETRERLRKLLHKKKTKRRPQPGPVANQCGEPVCPVAGTGSPREATGSPREATGSPREATGGSAPAVDGRAPANSDRAPNGRRQPQPKDPPSVTGRTKTVPVPGRQPPSSVPTPSKGPKLKNPKELPNEVPKLKESPSLKDLLNFIEGSDVVCRNEKKAAKKARQFEKKQMLLLQKQREEEERIRQAEEERLRKEREIEMLENLRRANNAKKKRNKKRKKELQQQQVLQNNNRGPGRPRPLQLSKPEFSPPHVPSASNAGAQMVTIKRVMEPHDSEPTVTITLRGATPKQDKVLYTLLNGKVCETSKNGKGLPKTPKDAKFLKETEKTVPLKIIPPKPQPSSAVPFQILDANIVRDNLNYQIPTVPTARTAKELTNPTSIQISNAVSSMTRNGFHDFNFEGIKLPPGITITKVDPFNSKIKMTSRAEDDGRNQVSLKPIPKPAKKTPTPEVIIVSTNKLKEESDAKMLNARQEDASKAKSISNSSKRRRRKKEAAAAAANSSASQMPPSYAGLDIEVIKGDEAATDLCNQMSVLTINPYGDKEVDNSQTKSKKKRKKRKKGKTEGGADSEDWNALDNDVFAPKDLDFDDEMDDAERELEAFKLFCMQSVPLKRKEKVNLNLKDLILKKKSVSCS